MDDNNNNKKFKPTTEWMEENYAKLNKELFNGELGNCILRPFTTGKGSQGGTLGWFKITSGVVKIERATRRLFVYGRFGKEYINVNNFYVYCRPCIELNANYSWSEHAMLATLAHEMCHYYTYMYGRAPKQGHGPEFYSIGRMVASRSKGEFTIQRLASAEQMSEMELDPEMQAKKDKRLANKKSKVSAILVYGDNGSIELSMTSHPSVIHDIVEKSSLSPRWNESERGKVTKVIRCDDADLIDALFNAGYKKDFRKYKYWTVTDKPFAQNIDKYDYTILFNKEADKKPYDLENSVHKKEKSVEKNEKRYFILKSKDGKPIIKMLDNDLGAIINALQEKYPNTEYDIIHRIATNPNNYQIMKESKNRLSLIIEKVINNFIKEEFDDDNDSISINPNQNLGLQSPLENIE